MKETKEKRKLKPIFMRKGEIRSFHSIKLATAKRADFRFEDTEVVIKAFLETMIETFDDKKFVRLPGIGDLYPVIKPSRVGTNLNGGKGKPTKMIVPDRYMLRFAAAGSMKEKMYELPILKQELEKMYRE